MPRNGEVFEQFMNVGFGGFELSNEVFTQLLHVPGNGSIEVRQYLRSSDRALFQRVPLRSPDRPTDGRKIIDGMQRQLECLADPAMENLAATDIQALCTQRVALDKSFSPLFARSTR